QRWIEQIRPQHRRLAHEVIKFHGIVAASYHEIAARLGEQLILQIRTALMFLVASDAPSAQDWVESSIVPPVPRVRVVRNVSHEEFAVSISSFCAGVDAPALREQVMSEAQLPAHLIAECRATSEALFQKALEVWNELTDGARRKWLRASSAPDATK